MQLKILKQEFLIPHSYTEGYITDKIKIFYQKHIYRIKTENIIILST